MNKKTKALTTEQYKEIIQTMKTGFSGCRPNERIATILVLEGNLGLRISDILKLRLCDIVRDGDQAMPIVSTKRFLNPPAYSCRFAYAARNAQ